LSAAPYWLVMPAAGRGERLGADIPKQYLPLAGRPMVEWSLTPFLGDPECRGLVLALAADDARWPASRARLGRAVHEARGGATRADSVRAGLAALGEAGAADDDWVLVHDAARPGITPELIARLITLVKTQEQVEDDHQALQSGGLLAMPVADTMKETTQDAMRAKTTIDRSRLWQAQTPQMFPLKVLHDALDEAIRDGANITDEASAIERLGGQPLLVEGATRNFKVTHPADWELMELVLSERR